MPTRSAARRALPHALQLGGDLLQRHVGRCGSGPPSARALPRAAPFAGADQFTVTSTPHGTVTMQVAASAPAP